MKVSLPLIGLLALFFLNNSVENFTSFIQYFYLSNDNQGLINYVMSTIVDQSKYSNSDLALSFSRMGEIFGANNLPDRAEEYHLNAISLMSHVIDYKIKYGSFLLKNNMINLAKIQYLEALSLNPTIKEIHANLGFISILNSDYTSAEISLKQALILDPDYLLAYENLVVLSRKKNDFENTRLYLLKILEIDPVHKAKKILENL